MQKAAQGSGETSHGDLQEQTGWACVWDGLGAATLAFVQGVGSDDP